MFFYTDILIVYSIFFVSNKSLLIIGMIQSVFHLFDWHISLNDIIAIMHIRIEKGRENERERFLIK